MTWNQSVCHQAQRDHTVNVSDAQNVSRKLVHITTGPLFMLSWPFYR
jgi:hypothetical protein